MPLPLQSPLHFVPLCHYFTILNYALPLQNISLQNTTPLCLCKTCPSVNSQYCAKPSQCIILLFHYVAIHYARHSTLPSQYVTPLHQTSPYHYITPHSNSIHRCSFTTLFYIITMIIISLPNLCSAIPDSALPLQIITSGNVTPLYHCKSPL